MPASLLSEISARWQAELVITASRHSSSLSAAGSRFSHDHYGFAGDISQVGLVLYQLLVAACPMTKRNGSPESSMRRPESDHIPTTCRSVPESADCARKASRIRHYGTMGTRTASDDW